MKIQRSLLPCGNVLLGTMVIAGIVGLGMAGYLKLVSQQYSTSNRSQAWNMAMPVAEAAIEEALTHLYYNGPTNLASEGWVLTNGAYYKERRFRNDVYQDEWYKVAIVGTQNAAITAQGFVRLHGATNYLSRSVQITTRRDSLFTKAMVAKGQIDMNGNRVASDSFDSTDPNYNTDGQYDEAKRKDNGDVATNSGLINSLDIGNADIWGHVATGPGGSISIGPQGSVGDLAWHNGGNTGLKSGWYSDDMNVSFPDVEVPFTGGYFTPTQKQIEALTTNITTRRHGQTFTFVTNVVTTSQPGAYLIDQSGDWKLNRSLDASLVVSNGVHANLLVTGDISLSDTTDSITIMPGASLKLYMQGSSTTITGQGVINQNGNATNFIYLGLTNNTSLSIKGNGAFTGIIYAPNAAFDLKGGGNDDEDFTGSSVTSTVTMNGHFHFHYDENLGRIYGNRGYIVTSWQEL